MLDKILAAIKIIDQFYDDFSVENWEIACKKIEEIASIKSFKDYQDSDINGRKATLGDMKYGNSYAAAGYIVSFTIKDNIYYLNEWGNILTQDYIKAVSKNG